jgi:hypothetical protein
MMHDLKRQLEMIAECLPPAQFKDTVTKVTGEAIAEISRLTDHIDLMIDEFKRIKAVHPENESMHNKEVRQLCERAISNTVQRVPVIAQRDKAEQKVERMELALSPLIDLSQNYNGQSGSDCLKIIRLVLAEAVRP